MASHSTRAREGRRSDGPRRMALSERAIAGESKGQTSGPVSTPCFVYILSCSDGTFYVGCTSDLRERERIHNEGHGSAHTAARLPARMVYAEEHQSWTAARKREAQLKHRSSHAKKKALVEGNLDGIHALARRRT